MKKLIFILLTAFFLFQCASSSALYQPQQMYPNLSAEKIQELENGRQLYIQNCPACHRLYLPNQYTKADWEKWMSLMKGNTQLTNQQANRVLSYLEMGAKGE